MKSFGYILKFSTGENSYKTVVKTTKEIKEKKIILSKK